MSIPYPDDVDEGDSDGVRPGWQPDPERPGYERWFDGSDLIGPAEKEPGPFSAFSPAVTRSMRPGPNRDAARARASIIAVLLGFVLQQFAAARALPVPGLEPTGVVLLALMISASAAIITAVFAARALRRAPRLGGRGISSLALGIAVVLGLAPVLLLVAIAVGGGL
ncbi:DUF2510 domain-containing protein [Microcella flavibacter]|uniref:DUF2510 domain-containing protein n=1 Tax=Microcella flavibacter TaxID=1804990 RepID=UPI00145649F9|nr:DUF2510 domain-containing protein [Microcella flavibacter]